ncbi:DUF3592 domain-containing protein [uncultured Shewanella sp.]|uniref:DUF3592 domain-containing protein n=1 Tax=uncultured Shewanella sp. TaxID=173975 RepID=UPI0026342F06|nr:DUF3592 domain-containing protein [uncultured Shewanella sp.]
MKSMPLLQKIVLIIAVLMLGLAFYMASNTLDYIHGATSGVGKVVDFKEVYSSRSMTYAPIIEYQLPDGKTAHFVSSTSAYPPAYEIGEPVDILYSTKQPQNVSINGFFSLWIGELIVGGLGLVFLGIGLFSPVLAWIRRRKKASLTIYGDRIDTQLQGVECNFQIRVNGRHPYQIITQGINPRTSQKQTFKSQNLWRDPTAYLDKRWITVYVDKKRPKRYVMDLAFLVGE